MGSKRRGILALLAGAVVLLVRGSDEAATLLARGGDDLLAGGAKSSDEVGSSGSAIDELVSAGKRVYRRERFESLLSDERRADTFTLPPGSYAGYTIETATYTDLEIQFETRFDQAIDAFVLERDAFEQYDRAGRFDASVWAAYWESASTATVDLERNTEYVLLFDYTVAGFAEPSDYDVTIDTDVSLGLVQ